MDLRLHLEREGETVDAGAGVEVSDTKSNALLMWLANTISIGYFSFHPTHDLTGLKKGCKLAYIN